MKIKIWNREDNLKGINKEVWFEAYPQARDKTLVLVDDVEVLFLEDINCTNEEEVKQYLENRKQEQEKNKEAEKNETEFLKEQIEKMKVDHAKQIAELVEKSESDKLELSTAIVELTEQLAQQG